MARFELRFKASVAKDLRGVPANDVRRILERIEALRDDPRPEASEKLAAGVLAHQAGPLPDRRTRSTTCT